MTNGSIEMGGQARSECEKFENESELVKPDDSGILLRVIGSLAFQIHDRQYGYFQAV